MLAAMSPGKEPKPNSRSVAGVRGFMRVEFGLIVSLGTVAIFLAAGSRLVENIAHPVWLGIVFLWLFVVLLWSAMSVVRHADYLAVKCGEPYGTLILTLSAISIEVMTISAAMLHGANNPTLARDMMFAVVMIALNGLVGLSLLLGGLRHHEQNYNLQGASAYLNAIMALAVLGLVLPNFTTSLSGPRFSTAQEIFLIVTSLSLYVIFLFIQAARHRQYFKDATAEPVARGDHSGSQVRSTRFHATMLFLYLIVVVILAEKFAIPLDNCIERFVMPQAFGGAIVA